MSTCVHGCGPRYRGALVAHVGLGDLLGRAALVVDDVGPTVIAVELGARAAWQQGRGWARLAPGLRLGLVGRAHDNRERLGAEVAAGFTVGDAVSLGLVVRPRGPADETFFGGLVVPAGVELTVDALPLALGVTLGSDDVFAPGAGDLVGSLMLGWRR